MACKNQIDIEAVCAQIRTACPWVESLRCFANNGATEIFTVLSNGAMSEDPVCLIPHGLTEEQVCELIIAKATEALTEEQICELILSKTLSEDAVCQLIKDTAILPSTLCAKIAELCPHVKDVAKVNGALVFTFTENVREPLVCPFGGESTAVDNGDGTTTTTHPDETTHTSCNNPSKSFEQDPVTGVITNTYQDGTTDEAAVTTISDNGDNTASAVNFDGSPCVLIKASAFSINAEGQCTLTLPGKDAIDIQDDISVEVVLVTDLGDGTGEVTGTNSTTCTFMKPPVSWEPADPADPGTWLADPANPGDVMSLVKDGDVLCGVVLGGAVCEIPKPIAEWSTTIVVGDGGPFPTAPTVPGTCSKVVNDDGELIGTVDDDGPHPIPGADDEWSTTIVVGDGDTFPTAPTEPGTCSKVVNDDGELIGTVDDDGPHPLPKEEPECCIARNVLDEDGNLFVQVFFPNSGDTTFYDATTLEEDTPVGDVVVQEDTSTPVDCEGNALTDFSPLTIEQGHAPSIVTVTDHLSGVDLSCAPPLPACPIEGMVTFLDGITWQIQGGAWIAVGGVSYQEQMNAQDTALFTGGDVPVLTASWLVHFQLDLTHTNTSCVCQTVDGSLRSIVNHIQEPDQKWVTRWIMGVTGGSGTAWDGTPQMSSDSFGYDPTLTGGKLSAPRGTIQADMSRQLKPGETIAISARVESRAPSNFFVAGPKNQLGIGNTKLILRYQPNYLG